MTVKERYDRMLELAAELADLGSAAELLGWDQETKMPKKGVNGRAHVSATLAGIYHEKIIAPELRDCLVALRETNGELDPVSRSQVDDLWRTHDRAVRLPASLVKTLAETRARASSIWAEARKPPSIDQLLLLDHPAMTLP